MTYKVYCIDPDYRAIPDVSRPFCIRCNRTLIQHQNAIRVEYVDEWNVYETPHGKHLIGVGCWKKITKEKS